MPPGEVLFTSFRDKRQSLQLALRAASEIHAAEIAVYVVLLGLPLSDISQPSPPNGTISRHLHLVGKYSAKIILLPRSSMRPSSINIGGGSLG